MAEDIIIVDDEDDIPDPDSRYSPKTKAMKPARRGSAEDAIDAIAARRPSLIILDIWLEGSRLDGMELLHIIQREHPEVPVVMISGHGSHRDGSAGDQGRCL